mgnify:CR=1 FL=1
MKKVPSIIGELFKIEIMQALERAGGRANSKKLLELINEERKRRNWKSMSPTTFNNYIKILVDDGLVEKHVISHKNVVYELVGDVGSNIVFGHIITTLSLLLDWLGYGYSKTDLLELPFHGLPAVLKDMDKTRLEAIKLLLQHAVKLIDSYLEYLKKREE